ncbi:ATP-binding protein [Thermomonospora cellulosilytica]|uniref:DNA-binding CsgD family transcriptional regulator n=1 Tax=Thermomonospora cellulosilytica TaxID=1411118 RepID=A0A7W3MVM7_9ACTN|nr:LuxR family transcriptional regulator [Thermomonospora cellulosilytica]MBA9002721.1 DNA-binding CsgD family transcriptional regulator [Thermomonospora cellulosilytica]
MRAGDPALVERDGDLAALVAALARPPAVVAVEGEPGAGKSRLVREALADPRLAGRVRLFGRAGPTLTGCPLGPVIEALAGVDRPPVRPLGPLTGVLRPVLPDLAAFLPPPPPPLGDPGMLRHRLVRAMAELLGGLGPAILVLEDLQWADEDTVELLRMIDARRPAELAVVVTCDSAGSVPGTARVRLSPLSPEGARRLAEECLGADTTVPRRLADLLYRRHGGVPRVLCEDLRLLRERGLLRPVDGRWVLADGADPAAVVPPAVGEEIVARAHRLGTDVIAVLESAAVLAESAEPELVAGTAGMDPGLADTALGEAARRGLLREHAPGGVVAFRHELARLAVYHAMPGPRRRRLHALAARELTRTGREALLVRAVEHHRRAGDARGWAASAEVAARISARAGAFDAAHAHLLAVLRAGAATRHRRVELAIKLGWAALNGGGADPETLALLAEARDRATPAQRAELSLLRAWALLESAGPERETGDAVADLRAALPYLTRRPGLHAMALTALATPNRLPDLDLPTQRAYLEQARMALGESTDPLARAVVLAGAARLMLACGDPEGWAAAAALVVTGERPEVDRHVTRALLALADAALHLGHYARALELAERAGDPGLRIRRAMGEARPDDEPAPTERDRREGASRTPRPMAGPPIRRAGGVEGDRLGLRLLAAQVAAERGRLEEARRGLRSVAEEACGVGDLAVAAQAAAEFNRIALNGVHRDAGRVLAGRVLEAVARKQVWAWAAPLMAFAPFELVDAVLPRYRGAVTGRDAPLALAALCFAEARRWERSGDAERAADAYRRARHRYAALPDPRMAAHACAAEARCRAAAGQVPDAEPLRQAWRTFTGLGATWDADRMKQLMRAAGLPVPHRRGRPGYGNRLSPREREIADLAAAGRTNTDIAADLCLSDRTVKFHLANAMRKLGVSSRRQLGDALEPDGRGGAHVCRCVRCGRRMGE